MSWDNVIDVRWDIVVHESWDNIVYCSRELWDRRIIVDGSRDNIIYES